TESGVKTRWRRMKRKAGITDFRPHDFRHDFGTKLLRQTGNLKLVSRAMNHASVTTTAKYAHVADQDVANAFLSLELQEITMPRVETREQNHGNHHGNRSRRSRKVR